jgi:deoxyribose-phosphate aldolase
MKAAVAGKVKVKASGGIRDWKTTLAMLEAGADRIGTSASLLILEEWRSHFSSVI